MKWFACIVLFLGLACTTLLLMIDYVVHDTWTWSLIAGESMAAGTLLLAGLALCIADWKGRGRCTAMIGWTVLISLLLTSGIDYTLHGSLTWSMTSAVGLVGGYLILTGFLWERNIWQLIALLYVVSAGVLFALDHLQGEGSWFFPIALPIATLAILLLSLFVGAVKLLTPFPFLLAGIFVGLVVFLNVGIDLILSFHLEQDWVLHWSKRTAFQLLPLTLLMCGGELAVPKPLKDRWSGKFHKAFE
jgi:hypothetical protein